MLLLVQIRMSVLGREFYDGQVDTWTGDVTWCNECVLGRFLHSTPLHDCRGPEVLSTQHHVNPGELN